MRRWIVVLLVSLATAVALASSAQFGPPTKAEVVEAKLVDQKLSDWELKLKLLESPGRVPRGKKYKKGSLVEVTAKGEKRQFKKGDQVPVRWMNYSAMGPDGPVGGLSWQLVP